MPAPVAPGQKIIITTPFHVKLPFNFSRGGYDKQSFQVTQWYPKPAVYDKNGWHPMPYLDQGEFYSEFGKFEVNISVPIGYKIAATGSLKKEETQDQRKINRYEQDRIHDFAWFADKNFIEKTDTCLLASGKIIDVKTFYTPASQETWTKSLQMAKDAVRHYSSHVGEYPYPVVQVVQGPESFGGGMEYPTITVISPGGTEKELDRIIAHEIGHNWFYGILATNEREHPWMDEGINSYYDEKYRLAKYGDYEKLEAIGFETKAITKTDQPVSLPAEKFTALNYGLGVYYKTAEWLRYLESTLGKDLFDRAMQDYYTTWKFKHPQPADFRNSFEKTAGRSLAAEFDLLNKTGLLPNQQRKGVKTAFVFNFKELSRYLKQPTRELVLFGPAVGINDYDKIMAGVFVTNFKLPPSPFQFFVSPMYATGSKKLRGLGFASLSLYPDKFIRKVDLSVNAASFTMNRYIDSANRKNHFGFTKIVPGIRFVFKEKNPLSSFTKFIQFRSFFINEDRIRFFRDTVGSVVIDKYEIKKQARNVHQLRFVIENNRELYPYSGEIKLESGKDFTRAGFTGNYFFNYPKKGGLNIRLFAGKFFYNSSKTFSKFFATERYHLNLSGPNGYEDYTYSDYFIGRNDFDGLPSQQMMIRDGAFKVRTDLLAAKIGRTDDWLVAANFTSDIPAGINPFNMLPVKIPLKLFLDIGTYDGSWKQNAQTDRFLFDAGLYLPLANETINIYIPLFYSSEFGDYFKSTIAKKERFWKKISFSIDISNFNLRKIDRNLSF